MVPSVGWAETSMVLGVLSILVIPGWFIFSKAGYSGWIALGLLIPVLNVMLIFFLAFSEWPVLRELERLRRDSGSS